MVLGLINFLLGGKKKAIPKTARVQASQDTSQGVFNQNAQNIPDGVQNITQNLEQQNINEAQNQTQENLEFSSENFPNKKKSISEALFKIHKELEDSKPKINRSCGRSKIG